jgi:hypothetical protein
MLLEKTGNNLISYFYRRKTLNVNPESKMGGTAQIILRRNQGLATLMKIGSEFIESIMQ